MGNIQIYRCVKVHMHRNPKTLTTFFSSGTKLLLPSWLFGFSTGGERVTQFLLCWLFHLTQQRAVHHVDPTGLASPRLENQLVAPRSESQLPAIFQKITQNPQPIASGHDVIHIPSPISHPWFLLWYLWWSHPPRKSVNTCAQCVPLHVH